MIEQVARKNWQPYWLIVALVLTWLIVAFVISHIVADCCDYYYQKIIYRKVITTTPIPTRSDH